MAFPFTHAEFRSTLLVSSNFSLRYYVTCEIFFLSCYYENNQEKIHDTIGVIRIEWQTTQWGERDKRTKNDLQNTTQNQ